MRITQDRTQPADLSSVAQAETQLAVRKKDGDKQMAAQQGDIVDISEEGRQKSSAMQAADADAPDIAGSGADTESGSPDSPEAARDAANPADLEKKLQSKKAEARRKRQKLDDAKRKADADEGSDPEVRKLENDVRQLQQEEKRIRTEIHSS